MIDYYKGNRFDLIKNLQQLNISKSIKNIFIKFFTEISSRLNSTASTASGAFSNATAAMQKVLSIEQNISTINNDINNINTEIAAIKEELQTKFDAITVINQQTADTIQSIKSDITNIKSRLDALENPQS